MRVWRCDLEAGIEERLAAGQPIHHLVAWEPVSAIEARGLHTLSADDLALVYAHTLTREHAADLSGLKCRVVIRARDVFEGFLGWASHTGVSFAPLDLTNGITVSRIIGVAASGRQVLPTSAIADLPGPFGSLVQDYTRNRDNPRIGVVSMPRTASKAVADALVLWAAPKAHVFHSHDLSTKRDAEVEAAARTAERTARVKAQGLRFIREMTATDGALFITIERPPESRIYSDFAMTHRKAGGDMAELLTKRARQEIGRRVGLYDGFKAAGVDFSTERTVSEGLRIYEGRNRLIVIHIERLTDALRESGLEHPLVSSNSASELGFAPDRERAEALRIPADLLASIYAHPVVSRFHSAK
jgi:hypothetical protein